MKSPIDDLAAFHLVFGKTVPDISLNAVANLGYAEGRWLRPVWPGDTLRSVSEVIGLKQNSNGKTGVVWVRTTGLNQWDEPVLDYVRWVMVRKRDLDAPAPEMVVPELADAVAPGDLVLPEGIDFLQYDFGQAGEPHRWGDYAVGEQIDHVDGVTVEEAEHMLATRLWQNTAKVHFDATAREDGKRLIYGGHVISLARALSFNGLGQCADDRGAECRCPCQSVLCGRYGAGVVRGSGQGRDAGTRCRRGAAAAGCDQGRGLRAAGRGWQVSAGGAA